MEGWGNQSLVKFFYVKPLPQQLETRHSAPTKLTYKSTDMILQLYLYPTNGKFIHIYGAHTNLVLLTKELQD